MKKYLFLLTLSFIIISCSNEDFIELGDLGLETQQESQESIVLDNSCYYWYNGEKIHLKKNENKMYVLFEEANQANLSLQINKSLIVKNKLKLANVLPVNNLNDINYNNVKWSTIDKITYDIIKYSHNNLIYESPYYLSSSGKEIGISHLFYVKLNKEQDLKKLIEYARKYNIEILGQDKYLPLWYTLSCNNNSYADALRMSNIFYESGEFSAAEPDIMTNLVPYATSSNPNDTYFKNQWNLNGNYSINWLQANKLSQGENTEIALIDQGVEELHPDFNFNGGLIGYDLEDLSYDTGNTIYGSHGTACAGIICATVNNGKGIAGIAPKTKLISFCHSLKKDCPNIIQQLANGLEIASLNYDVVSCSWGSTELKSAMIEDALKTYAFNWGRGGKGTVVVFATGNDNGSVTFPANCNDMILSVGSINSKGKRSSFSNYGSKLDVVAPGENIPTTDLRGAVGESKTDYNLTFSGTSAACPHVAAIAALMLSVNPDLTALEVNNIIESTARKIGGYNYSKVNGRNNGTWNIEMGYGLVDAYAAVQEALKRKNK